MKMSRYTNHLGQVRNKIFEKTSKRQLIKNTQKPSHTVVITE